MQRQLQWLLGFETYLYWFSRVQSRILRWDRNERDVLHFIQLLAVDANVLDIGANVGIMTTPISRHVRLGTVHAYEPIPENFRVLRRIVEDCRLDNVVLHEIALGDREDELEMVMPEQEHVRMQGLSHVVRAGASDAAGAPDEPGIRYRVPQRRLDDDPAIEGLRIDAIKMDVENFEHHVLRGASKMLERDRPLIYTELWDNEVRSACFALLEPMGYRAEVLENSELVPFRPGVHKHNNFFLVARG